MRDSAFQRFAGHTSAFGVYGLPTIPMPSRRVVAILAAVLGILALAYITGAFDHGVGQLAFAGGFVVTDRSKAMREKRGQAITEARSLLDAAPDGVLGGEDEQRYNKLFEEADKLGTAIEREERQAEADRSVTSSAGNAPTRPDPAAGLAGEDRADGIPAEIRGLPQQLRDAIMEAPEQVRTQLISRASDSYRQTYRRFLRGGMSSIAGLPEGRALQADVDTSGGFVTAPVQTVQRLVKALDDATPIRGLSTTFTVPNAEGIGVPTLTADPDDADWTSELGTGNEDSSMAFGKRELKPNPLAKRIKVSRKLLRQAILDIEALTIDRLAFKHAVAQDKAFATGSGAGRPLGLFTASTDGISTNRDTTAAGAAAIAADDLINLKHDLKPQYWRNARFLFHRDILKAIRKLKDSQNQYIWVPGLQNGVADTILDLPYVLDEFAPNTITTGLYTALLGDFSYYWIVDALSVSIQRLDELYAETNQVGFIGRVETDGMPVLEDAFRRLKQA